ncbi:hypothetical protein [Solimonas flava]|uniref:hypothetical protein n=1 Tax=Solimonas flava TaxID=415849 RepID=UPI0004198E42|nr:hypothetical protein [Solimonas flava]
MTKGWKIAALAVVIGVGTYAVLKLLLPHHKTEVTLEGLIPADTVFSGTLQSPAEVAAATATPGAEQAGAAEASASGPAVNTDDAAAPAAEAPAAEAATAAADSAAPAPEAEPAPATEVAAATPPAEAEPKPAPAAEAAPAPAEPPAAASPVAKARPAPAKTAAKKAGADGKRDLNASPWWQSGSSSGLQIVYAGSAAYRRAVVVMGNGAFGDAGSANQHIRVLDGNGKRVSGSWEVSSNNKTMLLFPVARNGRYQLVIDGGLADAQNRTLGQSLKGSVQVQ